MSQEQQLPEVMDLRSLRRYCAVSENTLRAWITSPENPLPAYRVKGKLYVRRAAFDTWMDQHRISQQDIGEIVNQIAAELQ